MRLHNGAMCSLHIGRPLGQDQDDRCDDVHIRDLRCAHRVVIRLARVAGTGRESGVGLRHRGRLRAVLDDGHGARRPGLRRDGTDVATRRGFALTVATIWLIPFLEATFGWQWAFAFLALGPALGVLAMMRLKALPEAARIAGGRG